MKKFSLVYFILFSLFTVFSYSLTDPNLVITSWAPYWNFQTWMWQTFFNNAQLLSWTYGILITALIGCYLLILRFLNLNQTESKPWIREEKPSLLVPLLPCLLVLLLSYNALSHDVFNYMFNAKMVSDYQANPHIQVALDFPQEDWLRFMHNVHTPAPYGYGWTTLSLAPAILGLGKFLPTWLLFRGMSLISFIGLGWTLYQVARAEKRVLSAWQWAAVFFSPLVLIEVISSSHNDLWMMVPAIAALGLVVIKPLTTQHFLRNGVLSTLLLAASVSIKFASLALVPLWLGLFAFNLSYFSAPLRKLITNFQFPITLHSYWPLFASMLMFLPLLSSRSQHFHPWYLTWSLVWLPLFGATVESSAKNSLSKFLNALQETWQWWLIALSFSSLYRYLPWLLAGGFEGDVLSQQKLVTWGGGLTFCVILLLMKKVFMKS